MADACWYCKWVGRDGPQPSYTERGYPETGARRCATCHTVIEPSTKLVNGVWLPGYDPAPAPAVIDMGSTMSDDAAERALGVTWGGQPLPVETRDQIADAIRAAVKAEREKRAELRRVLDIIAAEWRTLFDIPYPKVVDDVLEATK